jgi:hypothetical protein
MIAFLGVDIETHVKIDRPCHSNWHLEMYSDCRFCWDAHTFEATNYSVSEYKMLFISVEFFTFIAFIDEYYDYISRSRVLVILKIYV